ncbi:hypothetical protein [Frateuria sp. STR12]|uniref:hypothetical protein n=1 Tax=Frateuria hangzhouensis TaxID=2995589 RepID=UPI002260C565|nr:hypothetical protein [Frateuria sp. STR12]MCX7515313.1 hypothetical protein [Frateuria sp. STR12]
MTAVRGGTLGSLFENMQFVFFVPFAYFVGASLYHFDKSAGERLLPYVVLAVAVLALFVGYLEHFLGSDFWGQFDLRNFYLAISNNEDPISPEYGLPRSWIDWDFVDLTGTAFPRMVSFFIDPVGLGRFFSIALLLCTFLYRSRVKWESRIALIALIGCLFGGVFFTLSKGGLLTIAFFMAIRLVGFRLTAACLVVASLAVNILIVTGQGAFLGPSVANHFSNVAVGFASLGTSPLGDGLATNHVSVASELSSEGAVSDNYLGKSEGSVAVYAITLGWVGIFAYLLLFYQFWIISRTNSYTLRWSAELCLSILLTSLFAHSAFSLVGTGVAFVIAGVSHEAIRISKQAGNFHLLGKRHSQSAVDVSTAGISRCAPSS